MTELLTNVGPQSAVLMWNLKLGWLWILSGFIADALLGLGFQKEDWLGGYSGFRRRVLRLGHIAFFGTGLLNLVFFFTAALGLMNRFVPVASSAFIVGAVSMPLCCGIAALSPKAKPLFAVPVISLTTAGLLTVLEVFKLTAGASL